MPQNASIIATKSIFGDVFIFDYLKQPSAIPKNNSFSPDYSLKGHTKEGYKILIFF